MPVMKRLSVRFPADIAALLGEEATRRGISKSQLVREALLAAGITPEESDGAPEASASPLPAAANADG